MVLCLFIKTRVRVPPAPLNIFMVEETLEATSLVAINKLINAYKIKYPYPGYGTILIKKIEKNKVWLATMRRERTCS